VTDHCIAGHIRRNLPLQDESLCVPELVIFDCDGVLVDSELIFARALAECLVAVDFPTTIDEAIILRLWKEPQHPLRRGYEPVRKSASRHIL
jgi:phosphoglycolate phosphatase-like HAD superfamily hydrolase